MFISLFIVMISIGWVVVNIWDALGITPRPLPIGNIVIYIFGPLLAAIIYHPLRRRLAVFTYASWLKSFEEEPMEPLPRQSMTWRSLEMILRRWKRNLARRVRQIKKSYLLGGGGISGTEFPGDISLYSDSES
jgi:hypothetical protein